MYSFAFSLHIAKSILVDLKYMEYCNIVSGRCGEDVTISELESLVQRREADVVFCLHPLSVEDVLRISDAGDLLPPKVGQQVFALFAACIHSPFA